MFKKMLSGFGVVVTVGMGVSAFAAPPGTPQTTTANAPANVAKTRVAPAAKPAKLALSAAGAPDWEAAKAPGAWLWTDQAGTHLRVKQADGVHRIAARVCSKSIGDIQRVGLEDLDKVAATKHGDCVKATLFADNTADGIDFTTKSDAARVELSMDGKPMAGDLIHVGKDGASPTKGTFAARLVR